jgi:hypothetical protein
MISDGGIEVRMAQAWDTDEFDIVQALLLNECVIDWLTAILDRKRTVLIVCWDGVNCSAALVAGIMVFYYKESLLPVVRQLMEQRGLVLTNRRFRYLLVETCIAYGKPLGVLQRPFA